MILNKVHIPETEDTPEIILDNVKNKFQFKGISIVEDAKTFYSPAIIWVEEYAKNPNPVTIVDFEMEYCNTASSKQVFEIMIRFIRIQELGGNLSIRWHYEAYDDDMKDLGISFQKATFFDLELVSHDGSES